MDRMFSRADGMQAQDDAPLRYPIRPNIPETWPSDQFPSDLKDIYLRVLETGAYNYLKARIPIPSSLNIENWRQLASSTDLPDKTLCDMLDFGFPAGFHGDSKLFFEDRNHQSALRDAQHVTEYIQTELSFGALVGPMTEPPFAPFYHRNPLMTKDKKMPGGKIKKRIVTDLSWPEFHSVHHGISSETYMGDALRYRLPQADNLIATMLEHQAFHPQ